MSNFFRDSSVGYKSRTNIFSKFRSKETSSTKANSNSTGVSINEESESLPFDNDEADTSITNTLMLIANNNSNLGLTNTHGNGDQTTQQTSDGSIVSGSGKKIFFSSTPINDNQNSKKYPLNNISSKKACVTRNQTKMKTLNNDDDFEITEVRELEEHKNKSKNTTNSKNQFISKTKVPIGSNKNVFSTKIKDVSNSSSSDVLLEAFTYTQKICSNLKQELILKHNENKNMKIKLNTYENDINKVNSKTENLKEKLAGLEGRTRKLLSQKETDNTKIQNLKKEYEISKKRVNGYRNDIVSLKTLLNKLHDNKKEIEIESTNRAKEIEYLKRELDDCSGQLSEEKIKNGSFTQELETFKNEIVRNFKQLTELSGNDFLQKNLIKNKELYDNLNVDFKDNLEKESGKILTKIENIDINLFERLKEEYNLLVDSLKNMETFSIKEFKNITNISTPLRKECVENITFAKETITQEVQKGTETSIETFNKSFTEITNKNLNFFDKIQQLDDKLEEYQKRVIQSKEYEQIVKDLEMKIRSLRQQINENMSLIGVKEAQFEEKLFLCEEQSLKLTAHNNEKEKLMALLNQSNIKMKKFEQDLLYYKNLLNTEKANFDSKFKLQNEINNEIISENKTLMQALEELESYKTACEKEQDNKLDKFQKINVQFQKLNVESIQLKAHGLELEEENRNLKKTIEFNKESFQENFEEVKALKKNLILLSTERQDFIAGKLSLEDRNEEYKLIIKQLRTDVTGLKDKIKNLGQNTFRKDSDLLGTNRKFNTTQYPKEKSNSIFLQTQELNDSTKKNVIQQSKNNNKGKMVSKNTMEKRQDSKQNEEKRTIYDEFELSISSNDEFELTTSSLLYTKPTGPKIKLESGKENKKKLLLVDDFELDGPVTKKANLNRRKKK